MRVPATLILLSAIVGAACDDPCRPGDCPSDQRCDPGTGRCETKPVILPRPGRDAGPIDVFFADTGTTTDAGVAPDTGPPPNDVGVPDMGVAPDIGPGFDVGGEALDAGPRTNRGFVWVGEYVPGTALFEHVREAAFWDDLNQQVASFRYGYSGPNGPCELQLRVYETEPEGFEADRVEVRGFGNGSYTQLTLLPRPGQPGTLTDATPIVAGMFRAANDPMTFRVVSTGRPGAVDDFTIELSPPPQFAPLSVLPMQGTTVFLSQPVLATWTPSILTAGLTATLELSDESRKTVLTCTTDDSSGQIAVPEQARLDFLAASPDGTVVMDLMYEQDVVGIVPRVARPDTIATLFRLSSAVRWIAQF